MLQAATVRQARPAETAAPTICDTCPARHLSICCAIEPAHNDRLAAVALPQHCEAGETLLSEGDPARHFLNITQGSVKVYKLLPDGRRQVTGFLHAGDLLGLAFNGHYTSSAEALTPVRFCRFQRSQFEGLLDDFPRMEKRLLTQASNELAAAQEQMMLLGRKTAAERIASFLMALLHRREKLGYAGDFVTLTMTRTDIADYLGLTTETVSRTVTQLKKSQMIELGQAGKVWIKDRARLEDLADGL